MKGWDKMVNGLGEGRDFKKKQQTKMGAPGHVWERGGLRGGPNRRVETLV